MKVICKENFNLPFVIGKEYDVLVNIDNYPLTYKIKNEIDEVLVFNRETLCRFFNIKKYQSFKFGR
jgi:hypothetical protein